MLTVIVMGVMMMMVVVVVVVVVVAVTMTMVMAVVVVVVVNHGRAFAESSVCSIRCLTTQLQFLGATQGARLANLQPAAGMVATLAALLRGLDLIG